MLNSKRAGMSEEQRKETWLKWVSGGSEFQRSGDAKEKMQSRQSLIQARGLHQRNAGRSRRGKRKILKRKGTQGQQSARISGSDF